MIFQAVLFTIFLPFILFWTLTLYTWLRVRTFEVNHNGDIPPGPSLDFWLVNRIIGFYPGIPNSVVSLRNADLTKWFRDRYGELSSLVAGQHYAVFVNDYDAVKDALGHKMCVGRTPKYSITFINYIQDNLGILFSIGENAKVIRAFTVRTYRSLNFGAEATFVPALKWSTGEFVEELETEAKKSEGEVPLFAIITRSIFRSMWGFLGGESLTKAEIEGVAEAVTTQDESNAFFQPIFWYLPFVQYIPWMTDMRRYVTSKDYLKDFFEKVCRQKKEKQNYRDNPQDFMDYFLKEMDEKPSKFFHEEQLIKLCDDLLGASVVTSSNTLVWAIINIARNPRAYTKVMTEIDSVLGARDPEFEDRKSMPYLEATINEALRFEMAVPITMRYFSEPFELNDRKMPANTTLVIDSDGFHKSPKYWDKPKEFRPERFLDEDLNIKKFDNFIPFGHGKLNCLGEKTARASLFFFLVAFFQNFDFTVPTNITHVTGLSNNPAPFQIQIRKRNKVE